MSIQARKVQAEVPGAVQKCDARGAMADFFRNLPTTRVRRHDFFRRFNDRLIRVPEGVARPRLFRNHVPLKTAAPKAKAETNNASPPTDRSFGGTATAWAADSETGTERSDRPLVRDGHDSAGNGSSAETSTRFVLAGAGLALGMDSTGAGDGAWAAGASSI